MGLVFAIYSCQTESTKPLWEPISFNDNWEFRIDSTAGRIQAPTPWETVSLPHTPRIEPLIVNDQWQGICMYRKSFGLPAGFSGKRLFMKFDGAMNVATVWINGRKLTTHMGGFLPFVVDFTDLARFDTLNLIEVELDNTDNPFTGPKPLDQLDFNTYGGLYRDVWLMVKNPVSITDPFEEKLHYPGGILVTYPDATESLATIDVRTNLVNRTSDTVPVYIRYSLYQGKNMVADFQGKEEVLAPETDTLLPARLNLSNPSLWSPGSPDLYRLTLQVITKDGVVDETSLKIGIRRFTITPDQFLINGKEFFLRGVNRHQEYPYIGYALSREAQYRDARKIKEAGFDYVRLSHCPQSPAFMDACNERGLLVLDAIPGWQYFNPDPAFQSYSWQTCRDLLRRYRNHPCVLAWEVSLNESWMPESFIDSAISVSRSEYTGDQCFTAGWQPYGYDIYLQARQHRLHQDTFPEKPYIVSEYGDWEYYALNAGLQQDHWSDLLPEARTSRQLLRDGEARLLQQTVNIQEAHNDNYNTPAFADGYWVMFDYNRGYAPDLEASGIMSINRVPKFSYQFFRSQRDPGESCSLWKGGPMVFIASYWMPDSPSDIRIFSNCDTVDLFLNDSLVARQGPDRDRFSNHLAHPPFTFHLREFSPGTLTAEGRIHGHSVANHSVTTPGDPSALLLAADMSGKKPVAGTNDVIFGYARLVDDSGTIVPENNRSVTFTVDGDGMLLNPENPLTEAGIATALIRIGKSSGIIRVNAWSEGLKEASLMIPIE